MNVLITGASRGIGLQLTRQALEKGSMVYAVARAPLESPPLQTLKKQYDTKLVLITADLFSASAVEKISQNLGDNPLDIMINNAGIFREDKTFQDFMDTFQINSVIPFFLAKTLLPKLKLSKDPKVAQITSRMGSIQDNSSGGHYSYRASKAALNMINKSFSLDHSWLTTLVIHPGWVQTDMGGSNAPVSPEDSATGIWKVILQSNKDQSGSFLDYQGHRIPW